MKISGKTKLLLFLALVFALFCASFLFGEAAREHFVNEGETLEKPIGSAWAVGADGAAQVHGGGLYALTGSGLVKVDAQDYAGSGGLRTDQTSVVLISDRIRIGLNYCFSAQRDNSVPYAVINNPGGGGFTFGIVDERRAFMPAFGVSSGALGTTLNSVIVRPLGGGSVGIYDETGARLLHSLSVTGKETYLALRPEAGEDGGEPLIVYNGRRYPGEFGFSDLGNGRLTVMNLVEIETYTAGVVAVEMGSAFPLEALKAQAVAARSYAMYHMIHRSLYDTTCGFDLSNDEYSQAYLGLSRDSKILSAVQATRNEYLTYKGTVVNALYSAADGGETLNSEDAGMEAIPYLRGVEDPYEGFVWDKGLHGHKVGMSQWGANAMAEYFDMDYKEILGFYYTDVELSTGKYYGN